MVVVAQLARSGGRPRRSRRRPPRPRRPRAAMASMRACAVPAGTRTRGGQAALAGHPGDGAAVVAVRGADERRGRSRSLSALLDRPGRAERLERRQAEALGLVLQQDARHAPFARQLGRVDQRRGRVARQRAVELPRLRSAPRARTGGDAGCGRASRAPLCGGGQQDLRAAVRRSPGRPTPRRRARPRRRGRRRRSGCPPPPSAPSPSRRGRRSAPRWRRGGSAPRCRPRTAGAPGPSSASAAAAARAAPSSMPRLAGQRAALDLQHAALGVGRQLLAAADQRGVDGRRARAAGAWSPVEPLGQRVERHEDRPMRTIASSPHSRPRAVRGLPAGLDRRPTRSPCARRRRAARWAR